MNATTVDVPETAISPLAIALDKIYALPTWTKTFRNVLSYRPRLSWQNLVKDSVIGAVVSFFPFLATSMYILPSILFVKDYNFLKAIGPWPFIVSSVFVNAFVNSYYCKVALQALIQLLSAIKKMGAKEITKRIAYCMLLIGFSIATAYPFYAVSSEENAPDYYGRLMPFLKPLTGKGNDEIVFSVYSLLHLCGVMSCFNSIYKLMEYLFKKTGFAVKQAFIGRLEELHNYYLIEARKNSHTGSVMSEMKSNASYLHVLATLATVYDPVKRKGIWKERLLRAGLIIAMQINLLGYFFSTVNASHNTVSAPSWADYLLSIGLFTPFAWLAGDVADSVARNLYSIYQYGCLILPLPFAHNPKPLYSASALAFVLSIFSCATTLYLNKHSVLSDLLNTVTGSVAFYSIQITTILMTILFNFLPTPKVVGALTEVMHLFECIGSPKTREEIGCDSFLRQSIGQVASTDANEILELFCEIATAKTLTVEQKGLVFERLLGTNEPGEVFDKKLKLASAESMIEAFQMFRVQKDEKAPLIEKSGMSLVV